MGTTIDELKAIVAAQNETGRNYMMMETAVYTYHCFYVKELIARGELGRIQLLRGAHYQDLEGWPDYWKGLPPLHYATHAVAPLFRIRRDARRVGSALWQSLSDRDGDLST
jgi:predicted dehydrogenase